ncbi:MAG: hypothetical protein ACK4RK_20955 [Gemmataceae bacterium]
MGLLMFVFGVGYSIWIWWDFLAKPPGERALSMGASIFFPFFAVLGLGGLIFAVDREAFILKHGTSRVESPDQLPAAWWIIAGVAIVTGFGNYFIMFSLL